jgi:ATP-dependent DNA helicase RecQ
MHGISANHYHAGLTTEERNNRQQDWIKGMTRIMVCTNAFGMGIDKPDVRIVVHMDMPDCLENYYQEAGRAGRDGKKAFAVLLYDKKEQEELSLLPVIRYPGLEQIRLIYQAFVNFLQIPVHTGAGQNFTFHLDRFISNFKLNSTEALYALKALEQDGWLDFNEKNFAPSSIVFTTAKRELYEFEKTYQVHEPLLTTLLRTYEGIFDFPCFISETLLARLMCCTEEEITSQLKMLNSFGIISYTPRNDDPQIYFHKNRVTISDLKINLTNYNKRKDLFIRRIRQIISYTESSQCRSQFIGRYFGDNHTHPCGICDNCLKELKQGLSSAEFDQINQLIVGELAKKPLSAKELLTQLYSIKKEKVWTVIEFMQSERKLRADETGALYLC